jgi:hypothetical protein
MSTTIDGAACSRCGGSLLHPRAICECRKATTEAAIARAKKAAQARARALAGLVCDRCGASPLYSGEKCECGGEGRNRTPADRALARKLAHTEQDRLEYEKGRLRAQAVILRGQAKSIREARTAAELRIYRRRRANVRGNTRAALRYMDTRV